MSVVVAVVARISDNVHQHHSSLMNVKMISKDTSLPDILNESVYGDIFSAVMCLGLKNLNRRSIGDRI